MPLQLRDATFSDGPSIAHVMSNAFSKDAFHKTLFPDVSVEKQIAGGLALWPRSYSDQSAHYKAVVDAETGQVVSYSRWTFGFTSVGDELRKAAPIAPTDEKVTDGPTKPEGINDEFATAFSEKAAAMRTRILGERPHIHLILMATLPSARGRGAASLNLEWGAKIADDNGLACWVEASAAAKPLYEKFGFIAQGEILSPLSEKAGGGNYVHTIMMREPKVAGGAC